MWKLFKRIRLAGTATAIAALIIFRWGHLNDDPLMAAIIAVFITYHIFLTVLVSTEDKSIGLKRAVGPAIAVHMIFVVLFVAICFALQDTPLLPFLDLVLPLLALFEMKSLFGPVNQHALDPASLEIIESAAIALSPPVQAEVISNWVPVTPFFTAPESANPDLEPVRESAPGADTPEPAPGADSAPAADPGEYNEFLRLLQQNIRPHWQPGSSLEAEFERWRAARAKEAGRARASNPAA